MILARAFIENGYWHLFRFCVDGLDFAYCTYFWQLDLSWWL